MMLAISSFALNIKYIYDVFQSFNSMKEKYTNLSGSKARSYMQKVRQMSKSNREFQSKRSSFNSRLRSTDKNEIYISSFANEGEANALSPAQIPVTPPLMVKGRRDRFYSDNDNIQKQNSFDEVVPTWDKLTLNDKLMLFSYWVVLIIFSDILIFIGCMLQMFNTQDINQKGDAILGFGCMLTWISLLRYYENTRGYNVVLTTFQNSSSVVFKAIIGIIPVFIGFGILGMCLFWSSKRFMNFGSSLFSLFALMNGDMIFDTHHDLDSISYLWGQIYMYCFIAMAILVIQNVFISIIDDGYQISKYKVKTDWIKQKNNQGENQDQDQLFQHMNTQESNGNSIRRSAHHRNQVVTESNPFVNLTRVRKRDQQSREVLAKMLLHEKLEFLHESLEKEFDDSKPEPRINASYLTTMYRGSVFNKNKKAEVAVQPFEEKQTSNNKNMYSCISKISDQIKDLTECYNTELLTVQSEEETINLKTKYHEAVQSVKDMLNTFENHIDKP